MTLNPTKHGQYVHMYVYVCGGGVDVYTYKRNIKFGGRQAAHVIAFRFLSKICMYVLVPLLWKIHTNLYLLIT
jgi:hypothetical protein